MAIIVENGDGIANANSYTSRAELIEYAKLRGIVIADDETADVMLIKAMDYLETLPYVGTPTYEDQVLSWPRTGVIINGAAFPDDAIPMQLKNAQMQLGVYSSQGIDLMPVVSEKYVVEEAVGPIRTRYSEAIGTGSQPYLPLIDSLLAPLLTYSGSMALQLVRV